jgi:hypothetical protein
MLYEGIGLVVTVAWGRFAERVSSHDQIRRHHLFLFVLVVLFGWFYLEQQICRMTDMIPPRNTPSDRGRTTVLSGSTLRHA